MQQHESAIGIRVCPPTWTSLPPPPPSHPSRLSRSTGSELPDTQQIPTGCLFYIRMYVSVLLSPFVPPSPSPTVSASLFSVSASPLPPCKMFISTVFLDSIICINIQYLFFSFWFASLCIMDLEQGFLTGVITQRIQGVCKLELERIYIFIFINWFSMAFRV